MQIVIIVIHLMAVIALVGVILVQKSEGGGLGIGGGSGFMTARGAANVLTRTTAILAAIFFATSLGLSLIARYGSQPMDILDQAPQQTQGKPGSAPGTGGKGILDQLGGKSTQPQPAQPAPASPATSSANQPQGKAPNAAETTAPAQPATPAPAAKAPAAPAAGQQPKVPNQ
ncbi:MAG: preprotein translocase subunit SecG [Rhizobiaceae bacterium]